MSTSASDKTDDPASQPQPRIPLIFHDEGDLTLLIGDPMSPQSVRVSRAVMSLASPVWKAMFSTKGRWSEASADKVSFPEDDIDAMLLVLRISHLRYNELPGENAMAYEEVLVLADLCDKYDMVKTIRPFLTLYKWAKNHEPRDDLSNPSALRMTWIFGQDNGFCFLANALAKSMCTTNMIPPRSHMSFPIVLDELPSNIMERMLRVREDTLSAMVNACYDILDEWMNDKTKCRISPYYIHDTQPASGCRYMIIGSYVEWLTNAGLYPKRLRGAEVPISVNMLGAKLSEVKVESYPLHPGAHHDYSHKKCVDSFDLKRRVEKICQDMPDVVLESHRKHLAKQAGTNQ